MPILGSGSLSGMEAPRGWCSTAAAWMIAISSEGKFGYWGTGACGLPFALAHGRRVTAGTLRFRKTLLRPRLPLYTAARQGWCVSTPACSLARLSISQRLMFSARNHQDSTWRETGRFLKKPPYFIGHLGESTTIGLASTKNCRAEEPARRGRQRLGAGREAAFAFGHRLWYTVAVLCSFAEVRMACAGKRTNSVLQSEVN